LRRLCPALNVRPLGTSAGAGEEPLIGDRMTINHTAGEGAPASARATAAAGPAFRA